MSSDILETETEGLAIRKEYRPEGINRVQDVEPVVEHVKSLKNSGSGGFTKGGTMRLAYSIPNIFFHKWLNDMGADALKMDKREFGKFIRKRVREEGLEHFEVKGKRDFRAHLSNVPVLTKA